MAEASSKPGAKPLAGLRVLDLSRVLSGPICGMTLGDLGAEVIKIEDLAGGDTTRHNHPFVGGESHYYISINRNKYSVSVDLKTSEGREIVQKLAAQCDVLIENFRPGVVARLGLGYEELSKINPGIIHCSLSGFGQTGPWRDRIAYDLVIQALSGAVAVTGAPDRPPVKMGLPLADQMSGLFASIAILAALERRETTGRGGRVDVGMLDVGLAMLSYMANIYFATGESPAKLGSAHPTIYPYNAFKTADGYMVVAPFTNEFWRKFCIVIGRPELPEDSRFRNFRERLRHRSELGPILDTIMAQRPTSEWQALLEKGDVPNGPVNSVAEALEMDQTKARGMVVEIDHPTAGRLRTLGTPFRFACGDGSSFQPTFRPAPLCGQDTVAVLRDVLGYSEERIAALERQAVIRTSEAGVPPTGLWKQALPASDMPAGDTARLPLEGVRVLDVTRMFAGPYCGMILADLGADVIKIEEPPVGDPTRRNIPVQDGESTYYMAVNRGKRSIVLDLKQQADQAAFLDLARGADVVVENFRPGVMKRLGLDYEALKVVNSRIILCSISGFGQDGPLKDKISFDLVNQAMAGTMAVTGEENQPPVRIGLPAGDLAGGIFGANAVLAALRQRRKTGLGASIDLSLHDTMVSLLGYLAQLYFVSGESPGPVGSGHHTIAPYRAFAASDGDFVISAFNQEFWTKLIKAVGKPEWGEDPRFKTLSDRKQHKDELNLLLEQLFATRTRAEWLDLLEGGDVPAASIASVGEALESEQAIAREMVFDYQHKIAGRVRTVGTPFRVDDQMWRSPRPAPALGEHDEELLGRREMPRSGTDS